MARYVTLAECDESRRKCPGCRAVPLAVLVTVALAMMAVLVGSHLIQSKALGETREAVSATRAQLEIRSDNQVRISEKLDTALNQLAAIEAAVNANQHRKEPPK
ncbi:MAG TPA: hypothetical protein VMW52_06335 [Phycisphaerae bacterium]|nr:hypothetical protein [Phycisphaerae bacterium]